MLLKHALIFLFDEFGGLVPHEPAQFFPIRLITFDVIAALNLLKTKMIFETESKVKVDSWSWQLEQSFLNIPWAVQENIEFTEKG